MKNILLTLIHLGLLGVAHVSAECVVGEEKEVTPGYTAQFECGVYRTGTRHKQIASIEACAELCKNSDSPYCAYSPYYKTCVVGKENGEVKNGYDMYYMKRVEEDEGFPEPPDDDEFPEPDPMAELATCKAGLDKCDKGQRGPLKNALKTPICDDSKDHGQVRTFKAETGNYLAYRVACNSGLNVNVYKTENNVQTFQACLESCAADGDGNNTGCFGVDWHKTGKTCHKKRGGNPSWSNTRKDSAYHAAYEVGWIKQA